jgi:hypothetical protein
MIRERSTVCFQIDRVEGVDRQTFELRCECAGSRRAALKKAVLLRLSEASETRTAVAISLTAFRCRCRWRSIARISTPPKGSPDLTSFRAAPPDRPTRCRSSRPMTPPISAMRGGAPLLAAHLGRTAHVLVALWDGIPSAPIGGTAQAVRFRELGVPKRYLRAPSIIDAPEIGRAARGRGRSVRDPLPAHRHVQRGLRAHSGTARRDG